MEVNTPNQPINPPITPIQPVSKPVNNKKGFLPIIFGLLLLLVLAGGGVYYLGKQNNNRTNQSSNITTQPTQAPISTIPTKITIPDPTVNWKTYTNKKYGIEFKYPPELQLQENVDNVRILQNMSYIFEVRKINTNDDIETWWSKASRDYITPFILSKTQFNQKSAYYFKQNTKDVQVPMDMYAIKMTGYILTISYEVPFNLDLYSNDTSKEGYKTANEEFAKMTQITINQILSTFKFTDQNQAVISPSSSTPDLSFFNLLVSQDTNIKWGAIKPEKGYSIPQNGSSIQVDGYSREGTLVSNSVEGGTSMGNDAELKAIGWKDDADLAAGGVFGQGWGYRRTQNGKSQILQFSSVNITWRDEVEKAQNGSNYDPATFKLTCPCTNSYSVFFSNPF